MAIEGSWENLEWILEITDFLVFLTLGTKLHWCPTLVQLFSEVVWMWSRGSGFGQAEEEHGFLLLTFETTW